MGAGGYILKDDKHQVVLGGGLYYGSEAKTNNVAETKIMLDALVLARGVVKGSSCKGLTVYSDSDLLVRFVTRRARPREPILAHMVQQVRGII